MKPVAHRGRRITKDGHIYESLLSMYVEAYDSGYEVCECDVQETADHRLVVVHDEVLQAHALAWCEDFPISKEEYERIVQAPVKELTLAEVQSIPLRRSEEGFEFAPLFSDVFNVIPPGKEMLVELKAKEYSKAALNSFQATVDNAFDRVTFISFNMAALKQIHEACPKFAKMLLLVNKEYPDYAEDYCVMTSGHLNKVTEELKLSFRGGGALGLGFEVSAPSFDESWLDLCMDASIKTHAWYDDAGKPFSLERATGLAQRLSRFDYFNFDFEFSDFLSSPRLTLK